MNIGFILTKSPSEQGFKTFYEFAQLYIHNDQISIYLLSNGVYCARDSYSDIQKLFESSQVYVYEQDLKARGITKSQLNNGVIVFNQYDQMVIDVMENFDQVLSF